MSIHSRKMNLLRGIDLHKIAEKMTDASGAECKGVCSEAGMFALRERRIHVTQEDFGDGRRQGHEEGRRLKPGDPEAASSRD